ncbi:hypothetical protein BS47DRAFT_1343219 [Hydnum rufescens UP504]|uniref:Glucose receptor Git3 N-terminal domain-containing protein n=1 Tax=Hydnum rufescens UP504 TaxID=1448309 RepID=A0A9P6AYX8_9AGAM|nr:hypothetical protein BS47DRAFT_1343219 [Hydnum rufescens UP504]
MANLDPDNWNASLQNDFALRSGILLIAEVGIVSFIAVTVLLVVSIHRAIKIHRIYGGWGPEDSPLQPLSLLFLIAIFMDSIQAMGNILSARWAFHGKVTEGSYCTAQAVLKQIGNDGVSWFTIAIAVMTFVQTMFPGKLNRSQARGLAAAMIIFISLFLFLMITIPATTIPRYYGNTGAWCWIIDTSREASRLRIGSEYAYFWLAATVSFVLYGIIIVSWLREATAKRDRRRHREAISMGWYPIAYTVEIFPISLVRFLQWKPKGRKPQHGFIILAAVLFASSGAVNVLLWLLTGRRFGFSDPPEESNGRRQGSYMTEILTPVSGGMLSPVAGEMFSPFAEEAPPPGAEEMPSPGSGTLHSPTSMTGGESDFSQPSFPEDSPISQGVDVPGPYVWMPSQEGELGP